MHLFKRIRYDLSGQEIETLVHPGQATTMLGLVKYPDDFSKSKGLNQLWYKDTTTVAAMITLVLSSKDITSLGIPIQKDHLVLEFH